MVMIAEKHFAVVIDMQMRSAGPRRLAREWR
jgi:hypothetical protein